MSTISNRHKSICTPRPGAARGFVSIALNTVALDVLVLVVLPSQPAAA